MAYLLEVDNYFNQIHVDGVMIKKVGETETVVSLKRKRKII